MKCFSCSERFGAGEYVEIGGVCYCWTCSIGAIEVPAVEVAPVVEAQPMGSNFASYHHGRDNLSYALDKCAELKAQREAQPVAPIVAAPVAKIERKRCPHYSVIRDFFTVSRETGLDTSEAARDRMRGALGMLLGRRIESRADMSAADWAFATNAVRMNRVWW
jgi:hypothetical protein